MQFYFSLDFWLAADECASLSLAKLTERLHFTLPVHLRMPNKTEKYHSILQFPKMNMIPLVINTIVMGSL